MSQQEFQIIQTVEFREWFAELESSLWQVLEGIKMGSNTTSGKPKKFVHKSLQVYEPPDFIGDYQITAEALLDCLEYGDTDSFREVLAEFLESTNKTEFAVVTGIGRRTLYEIMDFDRPFNPELSTLMAIFAGMKSLARNQK